MERGGDGCRVLTAGGRFEDLGKVYVGVEERLGDEEE